jgi:hypothetical protein
MGRSSISISSNAVDVGLAKFSHVLLFSFNEMVTIHESKMSRWQ